MAAEIGVYVKEMDDPEWELYNEDLPNCMVYELEVIKGGDEFLRRIDVVIAEVSVAPRFEGAYGFAELIAAMDQRGFEVFDFLRLSYVRGGAGTQFADIAFKRKDV